MCFKHYFTVSGASLVAQTVKNLPAVWETQVWSMGQEDPLEKRMATHSSILGWRIPWTEEPGGSMQLQRVEHEWATNTHTHSLLVTESPECALSPTCEVTLGGRAGACAWVVVNSVYSEILIELRWNNPHCYVLGSLARVPNKIPQLQGCFAFLSSC